MFVFANGVVYCFCLLFPFGETRRLYSTGSCPNYGPVHTNYGTRHSFRRIFKVELFKQHLQETSLVHASNITKFHLRLDCSNLYFQCAITQYSFFKNPFLFELTRTYVRCLEWNKSNIENKKRNEKARYYFSINVQII